MPPKCSCLPVVLLALAATRAFVRAQVVITADGKPDEPDFPTPEYILPCSRSDPKLDACIVRSFTHLRPYLITGIKDLDLEPIEPLVIPELGIENGQGAVRVTALFSNITAFGPGNYTINKVRADLNNLQINISLSIPRIALQGRYDVLGNVLLFPINSRGDFRAKFEGVQAVARLKGVEERRNNIRYMRISKLNINFSLQRAQFKIIDQINGNNVIGQAMNQFLNQNAKEIIEEMRPAASASIAKHFLSFLNAAFTKIPMKVWLHDT